MLALAGIVFRQPLARDFRHSLDGISFQSCSHFKSPAQNKLYPSRSPPVSLALFRFFPSPVPVALFVFAFVLFHLTLMTVPGELGDLRAQSLQPKNEKFKLQKPERKKERVIQADGIRKMRGCIIFSSP